MSAKTTLNSKVVEKMVFLIWAFFVATPIKISPPAQAKNSSLTSKIVLAKLSPDADER